MTLVVSEVSEAGILMVGDSAVSLCRRDGSLARVDYDARKIVFSRTLRIGVACWGYAEAGAGQTTDQWVASFLNREEKRFSGIWDTAKRLASELRQLLTVRIRLGDGWEDLRCGFHVAGYQDDAPVLYHVHCGHDDEPAHEPKPYMDFPDLRGTELILRRSNPCSVQSRTTPHSMLDGSAGAESLYKYGTSCGPDSSRSLSWCSSVNDAAYEDIKHPGFFHLRNGCISEFVRVWRDKVGESPEARRRLGIACDSSRLADRFEFYADQLREVCRIYSENHGNKATIGLPITGVMFNKEGFIREMMPDENTRRTSPNSSYGIRY